MELYQQISIIMLFNLISFGISTPSCGNLKPHCEGTVCKIRLYPSIEMETYIRDKKQYRWMKYSFSNIFVKIIYDNNDPRYQDPNKYSEENLTLEIKNTIRSDEGLYKVMCYSDRDNTDTFTHSTEAEIRWPFVTTTTAPPILTDEHSPAPSTGLSSSVDTITLVTIAVCSVIIVVIISTTVCIVVRRKQTQESTEGARRLVHRDEAPEANQGHRVDTGCTVYNEIDVGACGAQSAASNDYRPSLPKRSIDYKTENVYDLIVDTDEVKVNIKLETDEANNDNTEIPVYAQVNKKRKDNNVWLGENSDGGYVVMFPKINCSDIAVSLGKEYETMAYPEPKQGGTQYVNFVSRSQRLKSRKMRNSSRKELQYAILDHPDSDSESVKHNSKETEHAFTPCQYALIDFNKKAFVAPLRKAPSSWYKRKNKQNRSKK
ncbi:hypothetical protein ACF0H5_011624 [Mactra antiquata]